MSGHQTLSLPPAYKLHYSTPVRTVHTIDVDFPDITVEVFGDPENGAYEWLIRRAGKIEKHSDCGYGQAAIALRDGLNAYFGGEVQA